MPTHWQLVGSTETYAIPSTAVVEPGQIDVTLVYAAIEQSCGISSKWLQISLAGKVLEGLCVVSEREVLQCSILLPQYATMCAEARPPRRWRHKRVINQPGVRSTSLYPELLSHEGSMDDNDTTTNFFIYIGGLEGFPCQFLRLQLDSSNPMVGDVLTKVEALFGQGVSLSFEGKDFPSQRRQYLHRIGISSGAVIRGSRCQFYEHPCDLATTESICLVESPCRKRTRLLLPVSQGRYWGNSTRRRRLMSTGDCGGVMGRSFAPLHEVCPDALLEATNADSFEEGGFLVSVDPPQSD